MSNCEGGITIHSGKNHKLHELGQSKLHPSDYNYLVLCLGHAVPAHNQQSRDNQGILHIVMTERAKR